MRVPVLLDHRGRPIERKALTQEVAAATVTGVRSPIGGYPGEGLTPARLNAILKEADIGQPLRYYELAESIEEKDLHYAGVLRTRKLSVAQIDISVEPAGDDAASIDQARMIEDWIKRDELADELFDILDAIAKGESFTEILWDTSEGDWSIKSLERRDPRWFRPSRDDLVTPQLITGAGDDMPLPAYKFMHMVARSKSGLPVRTGLARLASWFWLFKAMTTRDWAMYAATFGQPLRVGKYGPNASEGDKDTLFRAVASIAGDCAAIIPSSMLIEFIQPPSGTSTDLFEKRADWLDRQMSKAVLGQTATTDAIAGGHAVGQEHRQVQEDIERADARAIAATINRDLVRPWIDLQYGPQEAYPRVVIARPEQEDLALLSTSLSQLVPMGLRVSAREIRSKFGLGEPDGNEDVLQARAPAMPAPAAPRPGEAVPPADPATDPRQQPSAPALNQQADPGEDEARRIARAIDALAQDSSTLAQPAMDALIDWLGDLVAQSGSLEQVRSRLLQARPDMPVKALALALRQAQVVARLSGRGELTEV